MASRKYSTTPWLPHGVEVAPRATRDVNSAAWVRPALLRLAVRREHARRPRIWPLDRLARPLDCLVFLSSHKIYFSSCGRETAADQPASPAPRVGRVRPLDTPRALCGRNVALQESGLYEVSHRHRLRHGESGRRTDRGDRVLGAAPGLVQVEQLAERERGVVLEDHGG